MAIFFSIIFTGLEFVYFGVDSITATTRADPPYSVAANSNTLGKIRLPPGSWRAELVRLKTKKRRLVMLPGYNNSPEFRFYVWRYLRTLTVAVHDALDDHVQLF